MTQSLGLLFCELQNWRGAGDMCTRGMRMLGEEFKVSCNTVADVEKGETPFILKTRWNRVDRKEGDRNAKYPGTVPQ